jgi:(4S)-4-hydroxy-5-phosphonooxypentane-2,3-dione isomerase
VSTKPVYLPVYLFAKWKVREGNLDKVLSLMPNLAALSRAEEGCVFYEVHQGRLDPNILMLYECYRDEAALDAHRASEHFQRIVISEIVPLLESREPFLASLLTFTA